MNGFVINHSFIFKPRTIITLSRWYFVDKNIIYAKLMLYQWFLVRKMHCWLQFYVCQNKYGPVRLLKEFANKGWKLGGVKKLLKKVRLTGAIEWQEGSGRPCSVVTVNNVH